MAMDATAIANQFITSFYQAFDTNRASLAALYVSGVVVSTRSDGVHGGLDFLEG